MIIVVPLGRRKNSSGWHLLRIALWNSFKCTKNESHEVYELSEAQWPKLCLFGQMNRAESPIDGPDTSEKLATIDTFVVNKSLLNAMYSVAAVLKYKTDPLRWSCVSETFRNHFMELAQLRSHTGYSI